MKSQDITIGQAYYYSDRGMVDVGIVTKVDKGTVTFDEKRNCRTRDVLRSLADQRALDQQAYRQNLETRAAFARSIEQTNSAVDYLVDLLGEDTLPWWAVSHAEMHADGSGISGGKGTMSASDLAQIVRVAFLAGKAARR